MSKKIIALDAGHGMKTAGKRCLKSLDPNQTREWYLNDRIADMLQEQLAAYDCTVLRVDDTTGAKDISLSARVKAANNANADIYISIHHNAGLSGRSGGGTVVYYCSGAAERPAQAKRLYDAVVGKTGLIGNRSSKVIKYGFYVIKNTKMPAFLIENGFMDSPDDVPVILTEAHTEKTVHGILDFLVAELSLQTQVSSALATSSASSATATSSPGSVGAVGAKTHKVVRGDTLSAIAKKYGTTIAKIVTANRSKYPKITANYIVTGWTLAIPQ